MLDLCPTLQTWYNADVGIHNIKLHYKWVTLYRSISLRNKLRNVIKYKIGVHTHTTLYPILRYIGSTVYITFICWQAANVLIKKLKHMKWWKKHFINHGLQSDKYGTYIDLSDIYHVEETKLYVYMLFLRKLPVVQVVFLHALLCYGHLVSGYKIPVIENLGATLDQFDTIDFSDNDLRKLEGFPLLPRIKSLHFNNNRIWCVMPFLLLNLKMCLWILKNILFCVLAITTYLQKYFFCAHCFS